VRTARSLVSAAAIITHPRGARIEARVLQVRTQQRRQPDWVSGELGVSSRTVSAILRRHCVPRLRDDACTGTTL
jgi:hypothetical protein